MCTPTPIHPRIMLSTAGVQAAAATSASSAPMAAVSFFSVALSTPSPPTRLSVPFKGSPRTLSSKSTFFPLPRRASSLLPVVRASTEAAAPSAAPGTARLRLDNLGPQPGSRRRNKRKGRGIAAGQGNSCGFGMRGQKSRSGPGVRKGFEGGQMPLYRRIPKLRGIAGGMHAGLPKFVPINLKDLQDAGFQDGEEVSLESLKEMGLINPSGRERKLPLKILGDGELATKLIIKARAFSTAAKEKLEAAGCTLTTLPGRKKWVKPSVAKNLARADEYFAKKRAAAATTDSGST